MSDSVYDTNDKFKRLIERFKQNKKQKLLILFELGDYFISNRVTNRDKFDDETKDLITEKTLRYARKMSTHIVANYRNLFVELCTGNTMIHPLCEVIDRITFYNIDVDMGRDLLNRLFYNLKTIEDKNAASAAFIKMHDENKHIINKDTLITFIRRGENDDM